MTCHLISSRSRYQATSHIKVSGLPWLGLRVLDGFDGDHHIAHRIGVEPCRSIEPE